MVYIGGMAEHWPQLLRQQSSGQTAALSGTEMRSATAVERRPHCAAFEQQPIMVSSGQASAAGLQEPEGDEDGEWEMLAASASPDSSVRPVLAQQNSAVSSRKPIQLSHSSEPGQSSGPEKAASQLEEAGVVPSPAEEDLRDMSLQPGALETVDESRGAHAGDLDMHAAAEGRSLLSPRSASAAAHLSEGSDKQPPKVSDTQEQHPCEQSSRKYEHDKLRAGQQKHDMAATGAAAFDRAEVLWRCATFTVQVPAHAILVPLLRASFRVPHTSCVRHSPDAQVRGRRAASGSHR